MSPRCEYGPTPARAREAAGGTERAAEAAGGGGGEATRAGRHLLRGQMRRWKPKGAVRFILDAACRRCRCEPIWLMNPNSPPMRFPGSGAGGAAGGGRGGRGRPQRDRWAAGERDGALR